MDFRFTEEQQQLRDAVRKWVDKAYGFERRRQRVAEGGFDREAYRDLASLGLTGLYVPESHGGLGLGPVEGLVVLEELGRGMVLEPLAHSLLAATALARCEDLALQAEWLPRLADGSALVVLAHQERGARYRDRPRDARATRRGDAWTLHARPCLVPAGDRADAWLVPALADGAPALFLVPAAGATALAYATQDGARAADLELQDAPARFVGGVDVLALVLDMGVASACAEAVGLMEQALAATVQYLNVRRQFGVPIASFQALRHRVADMKLQLELARGMSCYASLKLQADAPERRLAVSRAKVQIGQAMRFVGQQAVQLHGGIAMTDEYVVSHHFKRLTQLEMSWGDSLHHLGEVSSRMRETAGVLS